MGTRPQVIAVSKIFGLVVALLSFCACQYDPYMFSYTTSKPDSKDIIGHWIAIDATIQNLA